MNDHDAVRARFEHAGQGQVFRFWPKLDEAQRATLIEQAREIDLAEIARLNATLVRGKSAGQLDLSGLEPAPCIALPSSGGDRTAWIEAKLVGEAALRRGKVAAFTVAGGQGTRLGYDGPEGHVRRYAAASRSRSSRCSPKKFSPPARRYGRADAWFIMTSHANHAATEEFFKEHTLRTSSCARACISSDRAACRRWISTARFSSNARSIALSPDGHGGSLRALERSGALDLMKREGIDTLSYFQVDNPLVRDIDPTFIGCHLLRRSEMSSKMVPKAYAEEKVGHFCAQHGKIDRRRVFRLADGIQKETRRQWAAPLPRGQHRDSTC